MSFNCTGARVWIELDIECSHCGHCFRVEYAATDNYAWEKAAKDFYLNGSYKMCPNPDCRILDTGSHPYFNCSKKDKIIKYDLGFQRYSCSKDKEGPGKRYLHIYNEKGKEIMRWRR